jgi:hypothetical protein
VNPSGRIALAALFLSLGARPWEIQPAVDLLSGKDFPADYLDLCQDAHDALALHRQQKDHPDGPHSRDCGFRLHHHGPECAPACPTCGPPQPPAPTRCVAGPLGDQCSTSAAPGSIYCAEHGELAP